MAPIKPLPILAIQVLVPVGIALNDAEPNQRFLLA